MRKSGPITNSLKRLIGGSGMTRYEIAKRSGVSEATLSRFMSGKASVTVETLDRLQPVLGIEIKTTRKGRK